MATPTRGTLRDHGARRWLVYYGRGPQAAANGRLVHVERVRGDVRASGRRASWLSLRGQDGTSVDAFGPSTKFWATPDDGRGLPQEWQTS